MRTFENTRRRMVEEQLIRRGIEDQAVLDAMSKVPREKFVPEDEADLAYQDNPLPIEAEQTISQPYIVALMTEELELTPDDRVLEIGTGSGYAAAVLGEIVKDVYTIERHDILARTAERRLQELGYGNVHVLWGDGTLGLPKHAPYDAIVATASGPEVPEPLKKQLAIGGRLVIPVGSTVHNQRLVRVRRISENKYEEQKLDWVRFVPLIGEAGWKNEEAACL